MYSLRTRWLEIPYVADKPQMIIKPQILKKFWLRNTSKGCLHSLLANDCILFLFTLHRSFIVNWYAVKRDTGCCWRAAGDLAAGEVLLHWTIHTHIHTLIHALLVYQEQFGVQYPVSHTSILQHVTGGSWDQTTELQISVRPALPPEPQPQINKVAFFPVLLLFVTQRKTKNNAVVVTPLEITLRESCLLPP